MRKSFIETLVLKVNNSNELDDGDSSTSLPQFSSAISSNSPFKNYDIQLQIQMSDLDIKRGRIFDIEGKRVRICNDSKAFEFSPGGAGCAEHGDSSVERLLQYDSV